MIKKINAAFEILSDKDKRKQYDATRPINNNGFSTEIKVSKKSQDPYYGFKNPTAKPGYPHETTVYPNQKENHNTTENEWMHERFGDSQSTRFRKDPSVIISASMGGEEGSKPPARLSISVEPTLCMAFGSPSINSQSVCVGKDKIIN